MQAEILAEMRGRSSGIVLLQFVSFAREMCGNVNEGAGVLVAVVRFCRS